MKVKALLVTCFAVLSLTACSKKGDSVNPTTVSIDANGNCTTTFIQNYDRIERTGYECQYGGGGLGGLGGVGGTGCGALAQACRNFRAAHAASIICIANYPSLEYYGDSLSSSQAVQYCAQYGY